MKDKDTLIKEITEVNKDIEYLHNTPNSRNFSIHTGDGYIEILLPSSPEREELVIELQSWVDKHKETLLIRYEEKKASLEKQLLKALEATTPK